MTRPPDLIHEFLRQLESKQSPHSESNRDLPRYDVQNPTDRGLLVTSSRPQRFFLGTGASIFTNHLIPAITSAQHEVILVTCFWAPSRTLTALCDALSKLAAHRRRLIQEARATGSTPIPPLPVRICLSSRSLLQKLLHPQSRSGYTYPPASWHKKLGLPEPALLEAAGIRLEAKSLFFLPFSVMHPKFVIIDRQRAFVPSCNVSWESWLEGCVEITGDAVRALFAFYSRTWEYPADTQPARDAWSDRVPGDSEAAGTSWDGAEAGLVMVRSTARLCVDLESHDTVATLVLPSPHHRNPRFRPFPWQRSPPPPATPLNIASLQLFERAQRSIYIQTPNLTCESVIIALLDALARGVEVKIVTNRNMMLLEQLVTAGTTTSWCIKSLIRRFCRPKAALGGKQKAQSGVGDASRDLEAGLPNSGTRVGRLLIWYFHAKNPSSPGVLEGQPAVATQPQGEEPVHSHLKLALVDAEYALLGSGNLDRASWFTSQELGILFQSRELCSNIKAAVDGVLEGRLDLIFDSDHGTGSN
ncbi:hypothetical protein L209DRAFT_738807 [Thermothelomyces heterothallicus CBS 203.75]